jgi:prepilin-type N-terminal cleavage/methylation domain-containing protein
VPRRRGFSLVELLVSMVLIVFVLLILSEALSVGLTSFRQLKALGDLDERLRTVAAVLRRDLSADHFEGKKRLSDANFWSAGPPRAGFFRIWQASPTMLEGRDGDLLPSYRSTDHALHFTVKLRGNRREDFLPARVPPGFPLRAFGFPDSRYQESPDAYHSQWAEVAYFLRPTGSRAGATPLFALHRRQLLVALESRGGTWGPTPVLVASAADLARYAEVSCKKVNPNPALYSDRLYFPNPTDLTVPQRRFGMDPTRDGGWPVRPDGTYPVFGDPSPPGQDASLRGADLLLTDVLSFDVRVLLPGGADGDFIDLFFPGIVSGNPLFTTPTGPRVFDTWSSVKDDLYDFSAWNDGDPESPPAVQVKRIPLRVRILAVQISIRVWDVKTQQARQITIVQDL